MAKKILLGLLVLFVVIQFFRPQRNLSGDETYGLESQYTVPAEVKSILQGACYDCHSNQTHYPWYANVQPIAWWLANHVKEGKAHVNYSSFTNRPLAYQNHKLEETAEMVEKEEMPLASYTYFGLHPDAKLTDAQRQTLIAWTNSQMDMLKAKYPADSLVMRRRNPPPGN